MGKHRDDILRAIGAKIAEELSGNEDELNKYLLREIVEAMESGDDVPDKLAEAILAGPFIKKLIEELNKE
jgi:translation initiation factor 2 beta subunit (eIF-2beta)/eIF-5